MEDLKKNADLIIKEGRCSVSKFTTHMDIYCPKSKERIGRISEMKWDTGLSSYHFYYFFDANNSKKIYSKKQIKSKKQAIDFFKSFISVFEIK